MSLIFRGLKRLTGYKETEWVAFKEDDKIAKVTEISTKGFDQKQRKVVVTLKDESEVIEKDTIELFTRNEIFCENAHKQFVVENAINFIPRIMLGFRPDYAVQLSMRFIIRLVSGHTEIEEICKIIENNERLVKYFTHIYEFSIHIYKGGLCYNQNDYNEELNKEVIQSYIELANCERYEEQESLFLNQTILAVWGDKNTWFTNSDEIKKWDTQIFIRNDQEDICIFRSEFVCVTCGQYFSSNKELATHVTTHDKKVCNWCEYEFQEYSSFLVHTLTFCKRPICSKKCLYCDQDKNNCSCKKAQDQLFKFIHNWVKEQHNTVYTEDLYSIIFDYYRKTDHQLEMLKEDQERTYTGLKEQELSSKLLPLLPKISILGENVIWEGKQDINFGKIKQAYVDNFESYQDIEKRQLKWMSGLRTKCVKADCNEPFSSLHVMNDHTLCVFARDMTHNEIPFRYEADSFEKHISIHKVKGEGNFYCVICQKEIFSSDGMVRISEIINHFSEHSL